MQEQPISLLEWCDQCKWYLPSHQCQLYQLWLRELLVHCCYCCSFSLSLVSVIISGILGTLFNATLADAVCNEDEDFPHDTGAQIVM